ncbi:hypothetical protein BGZ80_006346 [Entomortierella chlamydospora]|uniref:Uncharacterized protein n=1 Tax=Entomortierella chlamydospora TaxID=101097 RepID=A0A9P6MH97_9FUNG|nr:hypothetical protein BGZ80_006346 [Entomortierella chlamydospora]
MKQAGWTIHVCQTETDVAIAVDCQPDDVVISQDSDMLAYKSVSTIWRPISGYLVLEYKLTDVCQQHSLTRDHLTAIAVVSSNDYTATIVAAYLTHITVLTKNTTGEALDASLKVFVEMKQTVIDPKDTPVASLSFNDLSQRLNDLRSLY